MLISKELNDAISVQVGREFGASLQYVSIANYFAEEALEKLAEFFYKQADEERDHAMKLNKYLVETGGHANLPPIDAPKSSFGSAEEAIGLALNWEMDVTKQINYLMDIAVEQKDYLSRQFLDWFVNEQLEEVSTMDRLLRVVQRAGEKNLLMLEAYLIHSG
jgi:bacterioferritin B